MCGIAGIVAAARPAEQRETAVRKMMARMLHRGPDDSGLFAGDGVALGMTRLAIIDPAHGHQPMQTPDGRYTIVFNGAIYNYASLQAELRRLGHVFRTNCDTEVLVAAYAQHGVGALRRLRGMFACAIWDAVEHTLFVARDALGIKPLYYARLPDGGLAFASELNALLASGVVSAEIDPVSASEYLAWQSVPAPRTIYQGVMNLPPGRTLQVTAAGRHQASTWWQLPPPRQPEREIRDYGDFVRDLRAQLDDTIRAHRVADVPVGAFLSGGLDSTAIVGLMARQGGGRLKTFSLTFEDPAYSEQDSSRLAAATFGTDHHEHVLTGGEVAAELPTIVAALDQPTGDGINTYYASRIARAGGVKVALSGLGGDELFGSYPSFRLLPRLGRILQWWRRLPAGLQGPLLAMLRARPTARTRKLVDFLANARDLHELASLQRRVIPEATRLGLLAPEVRAQAARLGPNHPMLDDFAFELAGADEFQVVSAWELRTYMTDVLLRDSDVFSMAHSLELRVPFVDTVLLNWLWPQALSFKRDPELPKRALADAVADLVPEAIRRRPKQGFTLPFARWMRAELRPFLEECFSAHSLARCPWLDGPATRQVWSDYLRSQDSRAWSRVWTLAMLIAFANRPPSR